MSYANLLIHALWPHLQKKDQHPVGFWSHQGTFTYTPTPLCLDIWSHLLPGLSGELKRQVTTETITSDLIFVLKYMRATTSLENITQKYMYIFRFPITGGYQATRQETFPMH